MVYTFVKHLYKKLGEPGFFFKAQALPDNGGWGVGGDQEETKNTMNTKCISHSTQHLLEKNIDFVFNKKYV